MQSIRPTHHQDTSSHTLTENPPPPLHPSRLASGKKQAPNPARLLEERRELRPRHSRRAIRPQFPCCAMGAIREACSTGRDVGRALTESKKRVCCLAGAERGPEIMGLLFFSASTVYFKQTDRWRHGEALA